MNYRIYGHCWGKWPKWIDCPCPYCGELVPKFHGHICDSETMTKVVACAVGIEVENAESIDQELTSEGLLSD